MNTRRSPRNQEVLFKALFKLPEVPRLHIPPAAECRNCVYFPNHGRGRGTCRVMQARVHMQSSCNEFKLREGGR